MHRHYTVGWNARQRTLDGWTGPPVPAAAGVATQDDLQAGAAHGAVRLVAVFVVAVQRLGEVRLQMAKVGFFFFAELLSCAAVFSNAG